MTDASALPVKAINAPDFSLPSLPSAYPPPDRHQHYRHAPAQVDIPEDDGQISCICGYNDDDGWTVACDICNRWQHQSCYYPQFDELKLPDDLQHYCVDCSPRPVDIEHARRRQREKRQHPEPLTNGVKRSVSKSHKKKVKEPATAYTNGWPLDKIRHDRNSASPRDQPPPAKRPKTNHRTSDSVATTATAKGHSRKRAASNVNHRRSVSRSPDSPIELYSEQFLQCYGYDWSVTETNLHNSIAVSNALTAWLDATEDEFRYLHNVPKGEILNRWEQALDDIPGKAEIDVREARDESVQYQGRFPSWKTVTVKDTVANGAYIGELKGHVGFKKDYQQELTNRWSQLRHPEPFVFFHPKLPIVIDARHEGTELRYVRRSCMPNARLQILVTDRVDYHFCFMATQQIEPGTEVAVGWDTADGLPEIASKNELSEDEMETIAGWVSTALANCGPCACQLPEAECMMSRFDRRVNPNEAQPIRPPKSKKRKAAQHISPLDTHVNSRSGSEARKAEVEDEGTDSRSTSGSAGRGSASRDMTPNTHYSANGGSSTLPELSERERKKLAKEEEIFRRQEEEQAGKQNKKKRNSAGSNLNTPSATTSKQFGAPAANGSKYVDASTGRQASHSAKAILSRKSKPQKPPSRPSSRAVRRVKPDYVDAGTQCDLDQEEASRRAPTPTSRRPYISTRQRLLKLCARNNSLLQSRHPSRKTESPKRDTIEDGMDMEHSSSGKHEGQATGPKSRATPVPEQPAQQDSVEDVEMRDAPVPGEPASPHLSDGLDRATPQLHNQAQGDLDAPAAHDRPPPEPPETTRHDHDCQEETDSPPGLKHDRPRPPEMHIDMPPPSVNPFNAAATSSAASNTPGMLGATMAQSPASMGPNATFSPSVVAAVSPAPQKKKMSLSDYTRRKAKTQDSESKTERESSPASVSSGPAAPVLQPSSSTEARAAEGGSAIEEDVKMETATEVSGT